MDEFSLDRPELTGSLISMEFGPGGRIQQLWVSDPAMPDENEEFQFVCPPMAMGEELTEDYFPGTILIGARTHPEDPWVLSRNTVANSYEGELDPGRVSFEYELNFLEELRATGTFYEIPGPIPQIAWDVEIVNRSRRSMEIGELAFPMALNNVWDGFARTDDGTRDLFRDRVYVHPFIGGAASHLFAQRLNGRPPGLLIYPGEGTRWEFINHAPASLSTTFRWEGIPIVYAHSKGTIEREGWPEWFDGHSSAILEPGESRTYAMRFASADRFRGDGPHQALSTVGRPAIKLFPAAVAPIEVGVALEITGTTPTQFLTDVEADLETDADESGGFCFVRSKEPGPVTVIFDDVDERRSEVQLLLTEPIGELIQRRADYILENQVVTEDGPFKFAIAPASIEEGVALADPEIFSTPFGVESGLSEALYLAQKNGIYPEREQIQALDRYIADFLEQKLLNPGDHSIGTLLPNPYGVAVHTGRSTLYPVVFCLYAAMARIAEGYGETSRRPSEYRRQAMDVIRGMLRHTDLSDGRGLPFMSAVHEELASPEFAEYDPSSLFEARKTTVGARKYPFNADSLWNTSGFEEAMQIARSERNVQQQERILRYTFAARHTSPCWWWYGGDKRFSEEPETPMHPAMPDKGEMTLGPSNVINSLLFLRTLDRDVSQIDELRLRLAFGGMLGVWALVRSDGAAGMGFCPDAASKQFGMSWTTGDVGLSLYQYLRGMTAFVLPSRNSGVLAFGCHFEIESDGVNENYTVRPWDGVGARLVVRHVGLELTVRNARIKELRFDGRKRGATLALENSSDKDLTARIELTGLWGQRFSVRDAEVEAVDGRLSAAVLVPAKGIQRVEIKVIG